MTIDASTLARLRHGMSNGDIVLFTGAGFSRGARATSGLLIPGVWELKRDLWRIAFPARTPNLEHETLADIYAVAMNKSPDAVREILTSSFEVDYSTTPARYRQWFALPWYRHYTLNIDDLDEAIASRAPLPRPVISLSGALNYIEQSNALLSVHLNGRLRDFPNVTFSVPDFADRLVSAEVWYHQAVTDLLTHPVVFVGTSLDESGLWQHIALRRQRQPQATELRPRSYLVTPELPDSRAALLKANFNVEWLKLSEEEFFSEALDTMTAEAAQGHVALSRSRPAGPPRVALVSLTDTYETPAGTDLPTYLMGREPTIDDITVGHSVARPFEAPLFDPAMVGTRGGVLLTGTAATGKTTTALRLALACEAHGFETRALSSVSGDLNPAHILTAIEAASVEVLLVDNADALGDRLIRVLDGLADISPRPYVILAIRSSKLQRMDLSEDLLALDIHELTVPNLNNDDIDLILNALDHAHRLGRLTGLDQDGRRKVLRDQCGRQLVVGMYQATHGDRFHDKIVSECEDLGGVSRLAYGMVALVTAELHYITSEELEFGLAVSTKGLSNADLNDIKALADRGLIVRDGERLRVRHRWIADTAIEFFADNGLVGEPTKALISSFAARVNPDTRWSSRPSKILRRLLNHDYLKKLTSDIDTVRDIYGSVEARLSDDFHYWLQRGSLEVEIGDLDLAEVFLNSAASLAPPSDTFVLTESAYLGLKKAAQAPRSAAAKAWAAEALRTLESVIAIRGKDDSYPYHVYGSQGLSWARRAPMPDDDRRELLVKLRDAVHAGTQLHRRAVDLKQLHEDLVKEVLLLAVKH